jgi:hypothetical protein
MGRSSKPLLIVITDKTLRDWPEMIAYHDQGHRVIWAGDFAWDTGEEKPDLVLGPSASRMSEAERKWLPNAIMEGRRRRYPTKPGTPIEEDAE